MVAVSGNAWFVLVLLLFFMDSNGLLAQSVGRSYNFRQLEELALTRSFEVASANQRLIAAEHSLSASAGQYLPEILVYYRYFPGTLLVEEEDINTKHWLIMRLSYNMIEYFKTRPPQQDEQREQIAIEKALVAESARSSLFSFRKTYLELCKDQLQAQHFQQIKTISKEIYNARKTAYEHGEILRLELLKAEEEFEKALNLQEYYSRRYNTGKTWLADFLQINSSDYQIKDIPLKQYLPDEKDLINSAAQRRAEVAVFYARARQEIARQRAAKYANLSLTPYLGYRARENRTGNIEAGPEVGITFSLNLGLITMAKNNAAKHSARGTSLSLAAQNALLDIGRKIRLKFAEYIFLEKGIVQLGKSIERKSEEIRIEKARSKNAIRGIKTSPTRLLELAIEKADLQLQENIKRYDQAIVYYELLFLAGYKWPDEIEKPATLTAPEREKPQKRSLWVWKTQSILQNRTTVQEFISFCREKSVKNIFFSFYDSLVIDTDRTSTLSQFVEELHNSGISVSALIGDPHWIYPERRPHLLKKIQAVIVYNSQHSTEQQFDAIHLDIEPQALDKWQFDKNKLLRLLVETVADAKESISLAEQNLQLEIDIPPYYSTIDKALAQQIIAMADLISIMAYQRKSAEKVLNFAKDMIAMAIDTDTPFTIGLNAKEFSDDAALETLLSSIKAAITGSIHFEGFSIHHYRTYQKLPGQ